MIIELSLVLICHFRKCSELPTSATAGAPQFLAQGLARRSQSTPHCQNHLPLDRSTSHCSLSTRPSVTSLIPSRQAQGLSPLHGGRNPAPPLSPLHPPRSKTTSTSFLSAGLPAPALGPGGAFPYSSPICHLPAQNQQRLPHERYWVASGPSPLPGPACPCPRSEVQPPGPSFTPETLVPLSTCGL